MKKKILYVILFSCLLLFCGCPSWVNLSTDKKINKFENVYNLDEAWSTDVKSIFQVWKPLQIDNFLYIMEDGFEDYGYNDNYDQFHYVKKIDLKNGNVVGTSENFDNNIKTDLFIYDDFLYFFAEENNIIFLDKDSLNIIKIIKIGLDQYSYNYHCKILQYKDNLIWGNNSNADKKNMIMVNVPELFAMENGEEYIPKILYTQANGNAVDSYAIDGEILYFLTSDLLRHQGEEICTLYAYNLETKETLWKKEFPTITGTMDCSLQICNDRLYFIETDYLCCFNKNNGEIIWKKEQTEEDKYKEVWCAPHFALRELILEDNKVFFSGDLCEAVLPDIKYPKENIKNLFCYDLKNGKYVWGDLIPRTAMINAVMVVNDGKLFISTIEGFRIYDKDNGKLLGDYTEYRDEASNVFYYDNKYIFFDCHDMKGRYVAVTISEK